MQTPLHWIRTSTDHEQTVVLVHAVGYDLTYWDRQIEALAPAYNVAAFDLPGHGRSPRLQTPWTFESLTQILSGFLDEAVGGPAHLVGISFASMLLQELVLARPELAQSLTLLGTASSFSDAARAPMRTRAQAAREGGMAAVLQSSLERWFTPGFRGRRPDVVDRVTKTLLADDAETHAGIWDMVSRFDTSGRLGQIASPTLLLVGEHDPSTPPAAAVEAAARLTRAELVVIPAASHMITIEAPDAVSGELLRFLKRQEA